MSGDHNAFLQRIEATLSEEDGARRALDATIAELGAESGTLHLLGPDGMLHLEVASRGIPEPVLALIRTIPVGKGMAGLAVERCAPVDACNLQTDTSGDVRPGAKATGLKGSLVVPVLRGAEAIGALGVGNTTERTFRKDEIELLMAVGRAFAAR